LRWIARRPSRYAAGIIVKSTVPAMNPGWWQKLGIDPTAVARALWLETHPLSAVRINSAIEDRH